MTIRDMDNLIGRMLQTGPKSESRIHEEASGACTLYDVHYALASWKRNGWAEQFVAEDPYQLTATGTARANKAAREYARKGKVA